MAYRIADIEAGRIHFEMLNVYLLGLLCVQVAILAAGCSDSAHQDVADRPKLPNVVLLLADDLGWTGTSVRIDPARPDSMSDFFQTPALERIAEEGMSFSAAYAPHPICSPTRAGIQTGKNPAALHMTGISSGSHERPDHLPLTTPIYVRDLPDEEVTIAEFIKDHQNRYGTAHFGKWHLGKGDPGQHGYDVHDGATDNKDSLATDQNDPKRSLEITRRAVDYMATCVEKNRPFFVQLSYYALHSPIRARPATTAKYLHASPGRRHKNSEYAAMTEDLDAAVGMLLQGIDALGVADSTYVIFTSDNGATLEVNGTPATNNSPLAGGKREVLEGGIRVPLFIRGPGIPAGSISDIPVIGQDLFPTIAEWLAIGAQLPGGVEGGSLIRLLEGNGAGAVSRPSEGLVWHYPHYVERSGIRPQSAIRLGRYKLIHYYEGQQLKLFDLIEDIGETRDLSESIPEVTAAMEQRLNRYLQSVGAQIPIPNLDRASSVDNPPPL